MRAKAFCLFLLAGTALQSAAQYQENLPQAKPIPPNAAALFKTLERPIGTSTGTIPISFPLCSVHSGSLAADIVLNYNSTGGIRVEEQASCVGLGFSLGDGGGRITQIVRGLPDDEWGILNTPYNIKPSNFSCSNYNQLDSFARGVADLEPDMYVYSFNGHSGRFILHEDGSVALMSNDNIQIEYNIHMDWSSASSSGITDWTITDERGNKYYFTSDIKNNSSYSSSGGSTGETLSSHSWFLTLATDMNQADSLIYTYTTTSYGFTTFSGAFRWIDANVYYPMCMYFNLNPDEGTVTSNGSELLVTRIDARSGYIIFNSLDAYYEGPKKMTSIELHDPAGNLVRQYKFNYGTNFSSSRLKLLNFSEFGSSGTDSLTTQFDYNQPDDLPEVTSPCVDIWGYTGAFNYYFMPNLIYQNYYVAQYWDYYGKRYAIDGGGKIGVLNKITYPTGGYRELVYENNTVLPSGDFFTWHPDGRYLADRGFTESSYSYSDQYTPALQHLFSINTSYAQSRFSYTVDNPAWGYNYTVKIMHITDSTDLYGGSEVSSFTNDPSDNAILFNGHYRVDVFADNYGYSMTDLVGSWQEGTLDTLTIATPNGRFSKDERYAGGTRVKEIRDYDPVTDKISVRDFKYQLYSTDSTVTSGLLVSPVNMISTENISDCNCSYNKLSPGSNYPLATEGGSYVFYPEVRTIDSANGWIDQTFLYVADVPDWNFPPAPMYDFSYVRGKLLSEKSFDKNGVLIKKTINNWDYGDGYSLPGTAWGGGGIKAKAYWAMGAAGLFANMWTDTRTGPYDLPLLGACNSYYYTAKPTVLYQSIDSIFSTAGAQEVRTTYNYCVYNNRLMLKRKISSINSNKTKEETYKYPFTTNSEFNLGITASENYFKSGLLSNNYLLPIEVMDSIKTGSGSPALLAGSKYIFAKFNADSSMHLKTFRTYTSAGDSTELNFFAYDSSGNLRELYKTNDIKDVTIWGYNRKYPVAKVTGSDLSTVLGFVSIAVINNPSSDAALRTELDKIRTGLAGSRAQVTTYTYNTMYGMSSMTDPSGKTVYFEYDLFGRLKLVRDANNYIIKKYEYKLNNPAE